MIATFLALGLAFAPPENTSEPAPEPVPETGSTKPESDERKKDPREVYEAVTKIVAPTVLLEADYRQYSDTVEGNSGFALARARLGLNLHPTDWLTAVATAEFIGPNGPYLLDGYAQFDATKWLEITVGYSKPPLFAAFRHEGVSSLPMPGRSAVVNQMRVRRDVGVEARFVPKRAPIEAIVRLGNGATNLRDNDNTTPTGYAALDLVLGRAWAGGKNEVLGLRLGAAALLDDVSDHQSVAAATPLGYVYTQAVTTNGLRAIITPYAIAHAGPVRIVVEGAIDQEGRTDDDDGDPSTPLRRLDPVRNYGLSGELSWTIRGPWRSFDGPPKVASLLDGPWTGGALELAVRVDRFWVGHGAQELARTGGTSPALALKWWPTSFLALSVYGDATIFDDAPIDAPDRYAWTALVRASLFWR